MSKLLMKANEKRKSQEFRDVIRVRRRELDLTLEDIGKLVGVNRATVQRWESGEIVNMRRDKIAALAATLQVSPEYLMGWTDDPSVVFQKNLAAPWPDLQKKRYNLFLPIFHSSSPRGRSVHNNAKNTAHINFVCGVLKLQKALSGIERKSLTINCPSNKIYAYERR